MNAMKHDSDNDAALDRLLQRVPRQEAPAWFETRVMARVRTEGRPAGWRAVLSGIGWQLRAAMLSGAAVVAVGMAWLVMPAAEPDAEVQGLVSAMESFQELTTEENYAWMDTASGW